MIPAALGFRAHTGWAAVVAVAGPARDPDVILSRRIELADPPLPESAQVYHAAAELPPAAAEKLVRETTERACSRATAALRAIVAELGAAGRRAVASGIVGSHARLPSTVADIVRSHALIHSAEGHLYREALASASQACDLAVLGIPAKELSGHATRAIALSAAVLRTRISEAGRAVGRPWAQDQKESMLIAWVALVSQSHT